MNQEEGQPQLLEPLGPVGQWSSKWKILSLSTYTLPLSSSLSLYPLNKYIFKSKILKHHETTINSIIYEHWLEYKNSYSKCGKDSGKVEIHVLGGVLLLFSYKDCLTYCVCTTMIREGRGTQKLYNVCCLLIICLLLCRASSLSIEKKTLLIFLLFHHF